jgi:hypothetical protein
MYADAHQAATDVQNLMALTYEKLYFKSGYTGIAASNNFLKSMSLIGTLISTSASDPVLQANYILKANGIDVSYSNLAADYMDLQMAMVQRPNGDQTFRTTALTEWERISLLLEKNGGFDPTNIAEFVRNTVDAGVQITQAERELLASMGIDVDVTLELSPEQARRLESDAVLPEALEDKFRGSAPYCFGRRHDCSRGRRKAHR